MNDNKTLIYDYALEPELAAECDQFLFEFLKGKFSWDNGCLVVQYPTEDWIKLVRELLDDDRKLELLLDCLRKNRVCYDGPYEKSCTWLKNAEDKPFHAIIARDNPRGKSNVVRKVNISSITWEQPPPSITVTRTADLMADSIAPMLLYAKRIRFIDPYFSPLQDKFKDPLREFLGIIKKKNSNVELLALHASSNKTKLNWNEFKGQCKKQLSCVIPKGLTLTVFLWEDTEKNQGFHNRCILTDIGGVTFGTGLDENIKNYKSADNNKDEDTINRLSSTDTIKWINKYSDKNSPFALKGRKDIIGCGDF